MRLTRATPQAIKYACLHYHYSKSVPANPVGYNVYNDNDEWCGVILYAVGATPNIGKQYNVPTGGVLELVRVALNGKQEQTSKAVSMTLKQLKKDVPQCRLVVSYADCDQHHLGTIYQATNWIYTGTNNKNSRGGWIIHGKKTHPKTIHSRIVIINGEKRHCPQTTEAVRRFFDPEAIEFFTEGKRKYLMPLDKAIRKQILPLSKPYPKNDDWVKIDRTIYHGK
jgi:hypothetical protein